jgi:threonine dehydrogenase-like Zn-dependent dehydrogenase
VSDLIVVKEATIHGAFGVTARSYDAAIRLIESGRVPLARMHTHDFALADAERAVKRSAARFRRGEHPLVPRTRRAPG